MNLMTTNFPLLLAGSSTLTIVQHNCLGSWNVFISRFESLVAFYPFVSIVALQDPPHLQGQCSCLSWVYFFSSTLAPLCQAQGGF